MRMAHDPAKLQSLLAGKKIIVAGAGFAGLSFVLAAHKLWPAHDPDLDSLTPQPSITIYERDSQKVAVEREGYSISIRSDGLSGGMQVLQKLGLLDRALQASLQGTKHDKGGFAIWDTQWKEILKVRAMKGNTGLPVPSMRIARKVLRQILIDAVPATDNIYWEVSCIAVELLKNGRVRVQLSNGQSDECDLLIAADGASSKIRAKLRPNDMLVFAGAVCITGDAKFPNGIPPPVHEDWGCVVGANGTGLFASPIDAHSAVWSLSYLTSTPRATNKPPLPAAEVQQLLEEALQRGRLFAEPFKTLVEATDPSTLQVLNTRDKQPFSHTDKKWNSENVVFIGDSNHAMSPFAGNGANMALMDGWELAEQFCKAGSLSEALKAYDSSSMPRSKKAIRTSHWTISIAHAQGWRLALYVLLLKIIKLFLFQR